MEDIIKKILKDDSEKLIIMDGGRPKFVVMSYNHYLKLSGEVGDGQKLEMDFNELIKGAKQNTTSNRELSLEDLPLA